MANRTTIQFSQLLASKVELASQSLVDPEPNSNNNNTYSFQSNDDSNRPLVLSGALLSLYSSLAQSSQAVVASASSSTSVASIARSKSKKSHSTDSFLKSLTNSSSQHPFPSLDLVKQSLERYILLIYNDSQSINTDNDENNGKGKSNTCSSKKSKKSKHKHQLSIQDIQVQSIDDIQWAIVGYAALSVYSQLVSNLCTETLPLSHDILYWDSILNSSHNTISTLLYAAQTSPAKLCHLILPSSANPNPYGPNQFGINQRSKFNPLDWFHSNKKPHANHHEPPRDFMTVVVDIINSIATTVDSWYSAVVHAFARAQSVARQLITSNSVTNFTSNTTSTNSNNTSNVYSGTTAGSGPNSFSDSNDSANKKSFLWSSLHVFFLLYSPLNTVRREISDHRAELAHLRRSSAKSLGYLVGESFRTMSSPNTFSSKSSYNDGSVSFGSQSVINDNDAWKAEIQNAVSTLARVLKVEPLEEEEEEEDNNGIRNSDNSDEDSQDSSTCSSPGGRSEASFADYGSSVSSSSHAFETDDTNSTTSGSYGGSSYDSTKSDDSFDFSESENSSSVVKKSRTFKSKRHGSGSSNLNLVTGQSGGNNDAKLFGNSPVSLESPVVIAGHLLNIIECDVKAHTTQYSLVTAAHGKPGWFVRNWISLSVATVAGYSAAKSVIGNWPAIVQWFKTDVVGTLVDFYNNWIVGPLMQIYNIIRHDDNGSASLITKQSLQADVESLERMVLQFAIDHGEIAPASGASASGSSPQALDDAMKSIIKEKVRQGDISSVLRPYEAQITTPIKSLVTGDLVRSLLIQIQKTKVDVETAVSGIDKLLQSQQLVFGLVAAMPSFAVSYWGVITPLAQWVNGTNRRSRADYKNRESLSVILGRVDRILGALRNLEAGMQNSAAAAKSQQLLLANAEESTTPTFRGSDQILVHPTSLPVSSITSGSASSSLNSSKDKEREREEEETSNKFYTLLGLLLCETYLLRDQGKRVLPRSRLVDWDQDIGDLEDMSQGAATQQRVVVRIWNVYGRYLK